VAPSGTISGSVDAVIAAATAAPSGSRQSEEHSVQQRAQQAKQIHLQVTRLYIFVRILWTCCSHSVLHLVEVAILYIGAAFSAVAALVDPDFCVSDLGVHLLLFAKQAVQRRLN
jgi:hypothetical protein